MRDFARLRGVGKLSPSAVKSWLPLLWDHLGAKDQERISLTIELFANGSELQLSVVLDALFKGKEVDDQLTAFRLLRSRFSDAAELSDVPLRLTSDSKKRSKPEFRRCWFIGLERIGTETADVPASTAQSSPDQLAYVASRAVRRGPTNLSTEVVEDEPRPAIDLLNSWLNSVQQSRYGALLGDLGIGKTTTCEYWAHTLAARRMRYPDSPLPIYFALRSIAYHIVAERNQLMTLERYLQWLIEAHQLAGVTPQEIAHRVRHEGALVIFDGLDEVMVHMEPNLHSEFVHRLLSILPPTQSAAPGLKLGGSRRGRVLLTCRAHHFRTLHDQDVFMFAEPSGLDRWRSVEAFRLEPFSDEQVREFLSRALPPSQVNHFLELIGRVHDLTQLASRPLLLSLIVNQIDALEAQHERGDRINGARLYENFVQAWLDRDRNKHRIQPEHKLLLMEQLSAELTRSGRNGWGVESIEQWLVEFLEREPAIKMHYPNSPMALLKEDLRTATFVVREGNDRFRFAHASLQEFFLACHLKRALVNRQFERWQSLHPSHETLDFLGQLLEVAPVEQRHQALLALGQLRDALVEPGQANLLAFRYGLLAHEKGYPAPSLAGFQLQRLDLRNLKVSGKGQRLNLDRICLTGACLDGSMFDFVSLEDADLSQASLAGTQFHRCRVVAATFLGAHFIGALFRDCNVSEARFAGSHHQRTQWLHCQLHQIDELPSDASEAVFADCVPRMHADVGSQMRDRATWEVFDGHVADIRCAVFSPAGRHILSGSADASLKLWDVTTGECLHTLRAHRGAVQSVAFSSNGQWLLSGSADCSVRLWDAATGRCLRELTGHACAVNSVAFSPDSNHVLSGSADRSLKLWSSVTGCCVRTLLGHEDGVTSCAFSADGAQIVSGSNDRTLKLWDTATARCLSTVKVNSDVTCVAFSPHKKGRRVLSGSRDSRLHLWDALDGEHVRTLWAGGGHVRGVAFSSDGEALLSGWSTGDLVLWNAIAAEKMKELKFDDAVNDVAFSADDQRFLAAVGNHIEIYSAAGEKLRELRSHVSHITAVALSPNGRYFICGTEDGGVLLLDLARSAQLPLTTMRPGFVTSATFSTDSRYALLGYDDGAIVHWSLETSELARTLHEHRRPVREVIVLEAEQRVYSRSDDALMLWDLETGACLRTIELSPGWSSVALSADRRRLIACIERGVEVLSLDSEDTPPVTFPTDHYGMSVACSPKGARALVGQVDGSVTLWDIERRRCLTKFREHLDAVNGVAFSPDGTRGASLSRDGMVKIWDLTQGTCMHSFAASMDEVATVNFGFKGRQLMIAGIAEVAFWELRDSAPREVLRIRSFGDNGFAWWRSSEVDGVSWTGEAWRWLGALVRDHHTGMVTRYPIEAFVRGARRAVAPGSSRSHHHC